MEIEQNLGWVMILKVEDESNINQFLLISERWIKKSPETHSTQPTWNRTASLTHQYKMLLYQASLDV